MSSVHHIELWVPNIDRARPRWAWVLGRLGWTDLQVWPGGHSWQAPDGPYLVIEQSTDLTGRVHDRRLPGLNHLALTATSEEVVDGIVASGADNGWHLMFEDRHPFAGGTGHYAAFLADDDGYELEIVVTA